MTGRKFRSTQTEPFRAAFNPPGGKVSQSVTESIA